MRMAIWFMHLPTLCGPSLCVLSLALRFCTAGQITHELSTRPDYFEQEDQRQRADKLAEVTTLAETSRDDAECQEKRQQKR